MRKQAFWLTIAFIFTVPWEAAIQLGAGSRGSRYLGILVAAVWAVSVVLRGRIKRLDSFVKAYFVFLLWNGLTVLWSIAPGTSFTGFLTYTQIFGMILILWDLIDTEKQVETALQAFVLGAYVSSASVFVNWFTAPATQFPEHQRINALGFQTDGIALIIALAIPAAWHLATGPGSVARSKLTNALNFAYLPAAVFAIILTGTRGAAIATVPTFVFILWTLRRSSSRRRLIAWTMLAAGILSVMLFAPRHMVERITGSVADVVEGDSLSGRRDIWVDSLDTFSKNPIVGVGLDSHRESSIYDKEAHNTILSVLVESGLVGFIAFGYIVIALIARLSQLEGWQAWYWRSQIATIAIGSLSLSLEDSKAMWIMSTLAVVSAAGIVRTEPHSPARTLLPALRGSGRPVLEVREPRDE